MASLTTLLVCALSFTQMTAASHDAILAHAAAISDYVHHHGGEMELDDVERIIDGFLPLIEDVDVDSAVGTDVIDKYAAALRKLGHVSAKFIDGWDAKFNP